MQKLDSAIDVNSGPRPLNAAILVAMGTSFMLGVVFCLFVWEACHERLMIGLSGLGLVVLFTYSAFHRAKRIFAAIRDLMA
jgi:hypothetical protein